MSSKLQKLAAKCMAKTDQLGQMRKKRDLLSLSLVSKAVHEVFLQAYLWRSVSIEICEGSLDSFPPFVPNSHFLNYTRDVHFSSEFVRNIEERCPHFISTAKTAARTILTKTKTIMTVAKTTWEVALTGVSIVILAKGAASVLNQLQPGTLRSLRCCCL